MIEDRTVVRLPLGAMRQKKRGRHEGDAPADPRIQVELWDDGFKLPMTLFFALPRRGARAPLVGVAIGSEAHGSIPLAAAQLTHLAKNLPRYVALARAEMNFAERPDTGKLLEALNELGTTRRGKPKRVYREIAKEYAALVAKGDSAPVTSLAERHGVDKSTASRWLKEAKRQEENRRRTDERKGRDRG